MFKKIKSSIFLKLFITIGLILTISCLLIYSIVMIVMPQSYKVESNERFNKDVTALIDNLKKSNYAQSIKDIHDFCLENNAIATLDNGRATFTFGSINDYSKEDPVAGIKNSSESAVYLIQFQDSATVYTLSILHHMKIVNEITQIFYRMIPVVILLILLISAISSWICSRLLSKPILAISKIANKMTDLDMEWHCENNRSDELGILTISLNTMAEKLSETMKELEDANSQLQLDIDKERQQEKQRRDFFAAASHELKTPITIVKGQIESMIYGIGDYKNTDKYLPQALQSMDRMEALVKEILMVSKLNSDELEIHKEKVNLKTLVTCCAQLYEPILQEKQQHLSIDACDIMCEVDTILFKKVISNILSNAIKYSPINAHINISLDQERLAIKNSDVHIREENLQNVFRPLYRLEQSRNSATGGSGLGLYLVKNIISLHDYQCSIKNSEDGVIVTIVFSKEQEDK